MHPTILNKAGLQEPSAILRQPALPLRRDPVSFCGAQERIGSRARNEDYGQPVPRVLTLGWRFLSGGEPSELRLIRSIGQDPLSDWPLAVRSYPVYDRILSILINGESIIHSPPLECDGKLGNEQNPIATSGFEASGRVFFC